MNLEVIEDWMESEIFSEVCTKAESGVYQYARFVNKFMSELQILIFHLKNQSHRGRIQLQISKLEFLVESEILELLN